ncbi:phosphotransferase [Sphingomonas sp. 1P06PA]|uniref:phosphotransferase family protein n=1 Tax=Sphingomonas sp. 1P06PA TaxID=554121 RepID=UPI0039A5009C
MVGQTTSGVFAGFAEALPLSGFSGADVMLLRHWDGHLFVRKAAATPAANDRLRRQARRQHWLEGAVGDTAVVAPVEGEGETDGLYWYDMGFMRGRDAVSHLSDASFAEVEGFASAVSRLLERLAAASAETPLHDVGLRGMLLDKLADIDTRTQNRHASILGPLVMAAVHIRTSIATTAAHGDLTFENIIVDANHGLCLIDPIESPIEHYWMDLAKLFQDCEGRWHQYRRRALPSSISWALRQRFMGIATAMDARYPAFHYLLLGLTFARILPYAKDDRDRAFIAHRVETFGGLATRALETA